MNSRNKAKTSLIVSAIFTVIAFCGHAAPASAQVRAWGRNTDGQLGDGTTIMRYTPVDIGQPDVIAISGGHRHTLFLRADGTVLAAGNNAAGQLGDGTTTNRTTPVAVLSGAVAIAAGEDHSLALKADGTVWSWGDNRHGQLGDGTTANRSTPAQLDDYGYVVVAIAAGGGHSLALTSNGWLVGWGNNEASQIWADPYPIETRPVPIPSMSNVIAVAGGYAHTVALKADGTVWVWGRKAEGQAGNGSFSSGSLEPPTQASIKGVTHIAAGHFYNVALKADGTVWSWGDNGSGQAGNGTRTTVFPYGVATPTQANIKDVSGVRAGSHHTLARKGDGSVWAWGHSQQGQLGGASAGYDPSCTCNLLPGPVPVGASSAAVGAGGTQGFAMAAPTNPPALSDIIISSPVGEGGTATLSGSISDPDAADSFTLTVDWGDGTAPQAFSYPAGTTSFSETHFYADDNPTGTASDSYTVGLTLSDGSASDTDSVSVVVDNAAPALSNVAANPSTISAGGTTTLSGNLNDVGTQDTHTVAIDWGDGSPATTLNLATGVSAFSAPHQYVASGTFSIAVNASDDDTGTANAGASVTVNPVLTPPNPPSVLTATPASAMQINLAWADNSGNEDGFRIERCKGKNCATFIQIAQTGPDATAFSDTGVVKGTTYRYRVRAFNAAGDSAYSNEALAKTPRR